MILGNDQGTPSDDSTSPILQTQSMDRSLSDDNTCIQKRKYSQKDQRDIKAGESAAELNYRMGQVLSGRYQQNEPLPVIGLLPQRRWYWGQEDGNLYDIIGR